MKIFNGFFNLFHRKHRFSPQYTVMSSLKKMMFFGLTGFTLFLSASKFVESNLQFSFEPTEQNKLFIKVNPALQRGVYQPSLLMFFGIFQRLYARWREEQPYVRLNQQQFDGETLYWVDLHDKANHSSKNKPRQVPLVLVVAGSEGVDNTVKHVLQTSYNLGYRTIALNPTDLYDQKKLGSVVQHLKEKYPKSQLLGVGVEYGANLIVNFAANNPKMFQGLVSIGNPFDLLKSQIKLQDSWVWSSLCRSMLNGKIKRGQRLNKKFDGKSVDSLFEVDKFIYNIDDDKYVEWKSSNSCINSIKKITQTTLFIQSKQDPFTQQIGGDERFQNQKCIYVTTQRGGHNEWFQNIWMNRWITSPVRSFLKLVHEGRIAKLQQEQPNKLSQTLQQ